MRDLLITYDEEKFQSPQHPSANLGWGRRTTCEKEAWIRKFTNLKLKIQTHSIYQPPTYFLPRNHNFLGWCSTWARTCKEQPIHWSYWLQLYSPQTGFCVAIGQSPGVGQGIPCPGGLSVMMRPLLQDGGDPWVWGLPRTSRGVQSTGWNSGPLAPGQCWTERRCPVESDSQASFLHISWQHLVPQCWIEPYISVLLPLQNPWGQELELLHW